MITELDKAWLAGVMDANIRGMHLYRYDRPFLRLVSSLMSPDVVERVSGMIGSDITSSHRRVMVDRRQCKEHCPEPHIHVNSFTASGTITIGGTRLAVVLHNVKPYLVRSDLIGARDPLPEKGVQLKLAESMRQMGWNLPTSVSDAFFCKYCGTEKKPLWGCYVCPHSGRTADHPKKPYLLKKRT